MLKQPIYYEFNLDARTSPSKLIAISHVDDKYSEVLEVAVKQNDRFVYMGGATVIARMVLHRDKDYLLSDDVACSVNANGNILIPFDNAVVKTSQGVVKIEVNITRGTDELTLQFPLWVSVTGSILDNAEVTPESEGTIPDLLKDAADALDDAKEALEASGDYDNLDNKPQINGVTLSGDKTAAELGVVGWEIAAIDNCIEDGVLYSTSINNQAAYVLARNITTSITQYAFCRDGRVMWRTRQAETPWQPAGEWSEWEEIGGGGAAAVNKIYIGDTEPSGPNIVLWVDTSGGEPTPGATNPVTNLTGTATANSVTLSWQASSNAASYKIYQGDILIDSVTGTSYTINDLTADTSYTFGVVASGVGGDSAKVTVTLTTQAGGSGQLPAEFQEVDYVKTPRRFYSAINTGLSTDCISKIMMGLETDYSNYIDIINSAQTYNTGANTDYPKDANGSDYPNINNGLSMSYLVGKGYSSYSVVAVPVEYPGTTQKVEFVFEVSTDYSFYYTFGDSSTQGWNTAQRTIYYMRFYDTSDDLVADFIPCYRKSDNKVGMFDVIRQQFFTPLYSDWTKGSDV